MMSLDELVREYESEINGLYTAKFLEYFHNPKNIGGMADPDAWAESAGECNDTMSIYLKIVDGRIVNARFWTDGCGATIVCGSVVTELAKNRYISEAININASDIIGVLEDLPPENVHCAILAADTLRKALRDYADRNK